MSWLLSGLCKRYFRGTAPVKLLALILCDFADDEGQNIFPSIATLADQCGASERTIQRHLLELQTAGFLLMVSTGRGGTRVRNGMRVGAPTVYRISPTWINSYGANLSPNENHRVTKTPPYGDTAVSPEPSREPTVIPPNPPKGAQAVSSKPEGKNECAAQPAPDSRITGGALPVDDAKPKEPRPLRALHSWLIHCKADGRKPFEEGDPVFAYCDAVGITRELLELHWWVFKDRRAGKRRRDWPQALLNSMKDNCYRLWYLKPGMAPQLTTQGMQAQAEREAAEQDAAERAAMRAAVHSEPQAIDLAALQVARERLCEQAQRVRTA